MKKFLLLIAQDGGCDYTIGCGFKWEWIEAKDKEEAIYKALGPDPKIIELYEDFEYEASPWTYRYRRGETPICQLTLIECESVIDIGHLAIEYQNNFLDKKKNKNAKKRRN